MLDEFIDFVSEIFPCISPDVKYKAKDAVLQFEKEGHQLKFLMMTPLKKLSQGDIISNVPFARFSKDGTQKYFIADAIILSTSCHIDNKKYITLAPIFNLDTFDGDKEQLKKNKIYDYIYSLLVNANVKKDPEILNQALDEIRGMRDTWKEVMNRTRGMNQ